MTMAMAMRKSELRESAERRFHSLWALMRKHEPEWREYRKHFAPMRGRFSSADKPVRSPKRKNSAPFKIAEEFAAGMQSGLASPSRKWFTFGLFNSRMVTKERVKSWIGQTEEITEARMLQTNFYDQMFGFVKEEGVFNVGAMFIEEDDEDVFICKTLTAGEYAFGADYKGNPNRFARKLRYTTQQLVDDFGIESLPEKIRKDLEEWTTRGSEAKYEVCHLIQPNERYQVDELGPPGMRYQSLWWITGEEDPEFIRASGYHEFPVIIGRWSVVSDDLYVGEHPAFEALDDAKTLQDIETDARGALEREVKPAMLASKDLKGKLDNRPNRATFFDPVNGQVPPVQRLFDMKFSHEAAENKIDKLTMHIERAWYVDLFRMWASDLRQGRTATEVDAREAEKSYILGPFTLRQNSEVLSKCLTRIFAICNRAGLYPPLPPELAGQDVKIEYTSEFALLQKRAALGGIQTLLAMAKQLAELQIMAGKHPEALDRIDADEILEAIGQMYAISSSIILGDDTVAGIREDRAIQMQQQQRIQQAQQAAAAAPGLASATKDLSEADVGGESALQMLAGNMNGGGGSM